MSAPLLVPKGTDRSWTREFYRAINKSFRRIWWENKADQKIEKCWHEAILYGAGRMKI